VPTVDIDRETAHEAAQHELNKAMYPKGSLFDRIGDWLNDLLYRVIVKGSNLPGGWFTLALLLILVVIAIAVAVRIFQRTIRTNRGGTQQLFGSAELSAAEHRARAEQFAAKGDWASAIRHRLRAVARHLEECGMLDPMPGRTAGELARDAGIPLPGLRGELRRAATAFNDVTYGELPGTPEGYRLVADLDKHLQSRATALTEATEPQMANREWEPAR
jgi:hypothetical protein